MADIGELECSWMAAEKACNVALGQHRSGKGYWRRAKARRMLGKTSEAIKGRPSPLSSVVFLQLIHARKNRPPSSP